MDQCSLKETRSGPNIGRTSKDRMLRGVQKRPLPTQENNVYLSAEFSKVLDRANHLARVAVLVVVPGDDLDERVAVARVADHRLRCIEDRAIGRADDVAGDDLVRVVAERLRRLFLHLCVDLIDRDLALDHCVEERRRARRGRNALCRADELAVELGDDKADRLCRTRRVRDDVDCCCTAAAQVALALRAVKRHLVARVGMNRRHDTALDRSEIVQCLCHRCKAVRRAGCCRDNLVRLRQRLVVDVEDDRREIIARRSGDDDLLCAGLDMRLGLCLCRVEARALKHDIDIMLTPGDLRCIRLCVDVDLLAVDRDGVLTGLDGICILIATLRGVILQEMGEHLRARQIVDCDDFIAGRIEHLTEGETTDTTESIDSNFYCH